MSSVRKPDWLKMRPPSGQEFTDIRKRLRERNLHTVCEEANCPNLGECWSGGAGTGDGAGGTATFMLMGDRCSRACNFCDVQTGGMEPLDPDEPANVAEAIAEIGLDYVVLTSVDRDDLPDQGAGHFAETIREIKARHPGILVEVLIPDFQGEDHLVRKIIDAEPDVIAHNVETVERLQFPVRDRRAGYEQSLGVLEQVERESDVYTKTSIMLGHGEYDHEVYRTLADLRERGVDIVTLGQYLRPSRDHLEVRRYDHPDKYETWRRVAEEELDFLYCASGPMVRSSYKAGELFVDAVLREGKTVAQARQDAREESGSATAAE
ncbi:lipoyl synthase [Natronococcus amylolyticus DSM 10524]|uniref:Lipoyl synthase n=1 Tax=Natronococcus amylolyticus DSM 10524 TaxID=1227497 RepID=L9XAS6_9EURY|nr:lipoyl synthase [Natronococcus amylolyticus]ELY58830.1 lipoyl synthase [Natronococcus amylolyticus DSM 10524]